MHMNISTEGEEEAVNFEVQMSSEKRSKAVRKKRSANFSEDEKHWLAREVKEWPAIWDITNTHHSNKNAVDQAWRTIAGILDKPENECKSAWTALRESYRYHAKVARKKKSDSAGGQSLEEPAVDDSVDWEFGEDLSFLPSTSKKRKTFTTPVSESEASPVSPGSNRCSVYTYLSEDIGYVLYSALGSFYIPSCIMVFVYIRIYFAAKARARRGIKKHPRKSNNEQVTSFTTAGKGTIPIPSSSGAASLQHNQQRQIATIETPPNSATLPMQIPTVTCDLASDISTSEAAETEPHPLIYSNGNSGGLSTVTGTLTPTTNCKETLKVSTIATAHNALNAVSAAASLPPNMNNNNDCTTSTTAMISSTTTSGTNTTSAITNSNELRVSPLAGRCRALSVGIDTDMVSEFDPSSSDSGVVSRCAVVKPLKFRLCQPIFGRKSNNHQRRNESKAAAVKVLKPSEVVQIATELEPAIPKVQKPRDPEKEKRRIARKKEKRATLILGLIMGSFIACWLPFFFLYILLPACNTYCHIPDSAFAIAFWLGYMNSALNPAIYTIFNKDFRRAFRRILFK